MSVNVFSVIDNFLSNPIEYRENLLKGNFVDIELSGIVFRGIQPIEDDCDEMTEMIRHQFEDFDIAYNFARLSPFNQLEPNYIHTDDDMGDITCILYLNENEVKGNGTSIYLDYNEEPSIIINAKFNRMLIFDSSLRHSRNIFENFGHGLTDSRLIRVIFLKHKTKWE